MCWIIKTWDDTSYWASYLNFAVGPESLQYNLSVSGWKGTLGDQFTLYHSGMRWTTKDRDNDLDDSRGNCAVFYSGPWWYKACYTNNLNNLYWHGGICSSPDGDCYDCIHPYLAACLPIRLTTMKVMRRVYASSNLCEL